jgi:hypothetical protein
MASVRLFNDQAIAGARPGQPIVLAVPVTVYLGNSIQPARSPGQAARVPELQAVSTALKNGPMTELTSSDALLQDMLTATGPSQWVTCPSQGMCASVVNAAAAVVPDQLIIVAPGENPGVAAPLGWLLSQASQTALDNALSMDMQRPACGRNSGARPYCLPGVGGLSDLLLLTRAMSDEPLSGTGG